MHAQLECAVVWMRAELPDAHTRHLKYFGKPKYL